MNDLRWGVIGAGDVCERKSGPPLYGIENSHMVLVHRRNRTEGEEFVRRHGNGRYVPSIEELLNSDEIDAVYVASPHPLHAEHTIRALEAGKHVLVEKPMALSAADCDAMIGAAHMTGKSLAVAYYRRGYPSIRRIKSLLEEGAVGTVETVSINYEFPTSHRLDLVHFLLGDLAEVRLSRGDTMRYVFERMASNIEARTVNGAVVGMSSRWSETGMPEAMCINGSEGAIYLYDLKGGSLRIESPDRPTKNLETGGLPFTHWGLIENFVAHGMAGDPLLCDGHEGRKSTVILDALALASPGEDWVSVDYDIG